MMQMCATIVQLRGISLASLGPTVAKWLLNAVANCCGLQMDAPFCLISFMDGR